MWWEDGKADHFEAAIWCFPEFGHCAKHAFQVLQIPLWVVGLFTALRNVGWIPSKRVQCVYSTNTYMCLLSDCVKKNQIWVPELSSIYPSASKECQYITLNLTISLTFAILAAYTFSYQQYIWSLLQHAPSLCRFFPCMQTPAVDWRNPGPGGGLAREPGNHPKAHSPPHTHTTTTTTSHTHNPLLRVHTPVPWSGPLSAASLNPRNPRVVLLFDPKKSEGFIHIQVLHSKHRPVQMKHIHIHVHTVHACVGLILQVPSFNLQLALNVP